MIIYKLQRSFRQEILDVQGLLESYPFCDSRLKAKETSGPTLWT